MNFTDEMISEIKTLYAEGESLRGIARSFGTNHKAISKLLKNKMIEIKSTKTKSVFRNLKISQYWSVLKIVLKTINFTPLEFINFF